MPSSFSWLDFAESDRQRAMQVIDLFREKTTVDELGFAPIRDAFADYLFPGTSTIQTRARYFLFVPWIFQRYDRKAMTAHELARKVRTRETRLIEALIRGGQDQGGIIGKRARATLERMPSSVYWRGLREWGIRLFSGSIDQYMRRHARERSRALAAERSSYEPLEAPVRNWHPSLPEEPSSLYEAATFELTQEEAEFLRDRILAHQPRSMLAYLVHAQLPEFNAVYAWDDEAAGLLPSDLRSEVEHARRFALCAWGGPLAYSRLIAVAKRDGELVGKLHEALQGWQQALQAEQNLLETWDLDSFWSLVHRLHPRLTQPTHTFAKDWIELAFKAAAGHAVWEDPYVAQRIAGRERQLKGPRARLNPENQRGRDRWQGDASGGPMDFRWGPTRIVVNDILAGLNGGRGGSGA